MSCRGYDTTPRVDHLADLRANCVLGARRVVLERQARHQQRLALWVDRDQAKVAGGAHAAVAFQRVLGVDMHAHDHRRAADEDHARDRLDDFAGVDGRAKVDPLARGGDERLAAKAQPGDCGGLIHQRHHLAAEHGIKIVRKKEN